MYFENIEIGAAKLINFVWKCNILVSMKFESPNLS